MKSLIITGILAALIFQLFSCSKEPINEPETWLLTDSVVNAAEAYWPQLKSMMLADDVTNYGFNSPSELEQIQIGSPFRLVELKEDFRTDSVYESFEKYVVIYRTWKVPVLVENEFRLFITVADFKDSIQGVGGGGSTGAVRADECIKKYNIQSEDRYMIEEHVYGNCVFIMTKTGDSYTIYPESETLPIVDWNPGYCKNLDKVYSSFEELFYEFKNADSCFSPYCPGCLD